MISQVVVFVHPPCFYFRRKKQDSPVPPSLVWCMRGLREEPPQSRAFSLNSHPVPGPLCALLYLLYSATLWGLVVPYSCFTRWEMKVQRGSMACPMFLILEAEEPKCETQSDSEPSHPTTVLLPYNEVSSTSHQPGN